MKRLLQLSAACGVALVVVASLADPPPRPVASAAPAASAPVKTKARKDNSPHSDERPKMPDAPHLAPAIGDVLRQPAAASRGQKTKAPAGQRDAREATAGRLLDQLQTRQAQRQRAREQRRQASRHAVLERYTHVLDQPEVLRELERHARRSARLNRILDIAKQHHLDDVLARAQPLLRYENERHAQAMVELSGVGQTAASTAPSASVRGSQQPVPSTAPSSRPLPPAAPSAQRPSAVP